VITNAGVQQGWKLDATGNWRNFTQFDPSNSGNTLDQERRSNAANEIIRIGGGVGTPWQTPGYDRAGNMTTIPQPNSLTLPSAGVFDAWQRLRFVIDSTSGRPVTVQENQYDGRSYRIVRISGGQGTHVYYSASWQVLEERILGSSSSSGSSISSSSSAESNLIPDLQNVWGLRYIDDLVLRDRSVSGTLDERLYGLQDANWNMVAVSDTLGIVRQRFNYTAYGACTLLNPDFTAYDGPTNYDWTVLYTERHFDVYSALYYFRWRYYHTLLGLFISRDSMGFTAGDTNFYRYVVNCPSTLVDPLGLVPICGPEVGIVSVINDFSAGDVNADELIREWERTHPGKPYYAGFPAIILAALGELSNSANPALPANIGKPALNALLNLKEQRGFLIARVCIDCENGKVKTWNWSRDAGDGFTPIRLSRAGPVLHYDAAEGGTKDPDGDIDPRPQCATFEFDHYARVGKLGQAMANLVSGLGVPYNWQHIKYTLCCDGSVSYEFSGSYFPSQYAYVNGVQTKRHLQTGLPQFIFAGDRARAPGGNF
jgi:RHS repeat-associated protein